MRRVVRSSLFVACIGVINLVSASVFPFSGDVVTDWNNAALDAIRAGPNRAADCFPQPRHSSRRDL